MRSSTLFLTAAVGFVFLTAGCATKHKGTYEVMQASGAADQAEALKADAESAWNQRDDKAQLTTALTKYESAYQANPTDREVATRLVRGWYLMGDIHESEKEAKLAAWDVAVTWGKRCIAINSEFTALLEKGDETEATAVRVATKDDAPCVYWTATALGKWGKLSGLAKTLKHLPTVKAYITKVSDVAPEYFHGAPDRYWGAYFAAIPSFAGQDLDKSRKHFDKSIEMAPDYLGTRVLLAEYWAVKKQDKATFETALQHVLDADTNAIEAIAPENRAEQKKAKSLMERKGDFFAD